MLVVWQHLVINVLHHWSSIAEFWTLPRNDIVVQSSDPYFSSVVVTMAGTRLGAIGVALFFLTLTFAALTLRVTRRETIEL